VRSVPPIAETIETVDGEFDLKILTIPSHLGFVGDIPRISGSPVRFGVGKFFRIS